MFVSPAMSKLEDVQPKMDACSAQVETYFFTNSKGKKKAMENKRKMPKSSLNNRELF